MRAEDRWVIIVLELEVKHVRMTCATDISSLGTSSLSAISSCTAGAGTISGTIGGAGFKGCFLENVGVSRKVVREHAHRQD